MRNTINTNSQMHGKAFENMLKAVFNASDTKRMSTQKFDIEAKFNKEQNLPMSIKAIAEDGGLCLADARRFFENEEPFIMLVGQYIQKDEKKVFRSIKEIKITLETLNKLKGEVTYEEVKDFHEEITKFDYGYHIEAREFAKKKLQELKKKKSLIKLNPKIDSKTQRRLQCSINMDDLENTVGLENIKTHTESFGFLTLPIVIFSEKRKVAMKVDPKVLAAKALDQFYTKQELAKACVKEVQSYIEENDMIVDTIIEPSAGAGAFVQEIQSEIKDINQKRFLAYDIEPKVPDIIECDYLDLNTEHLRKNTIIIGNPPFGKNSSLAIKFFNKSAEFAEMIAFIVPKTFKKVSVINKLNLNFHLEKEVDVPENSFLVLGQEMDVPCVFQIWRKKDNARSKINPDAICEDYSFEKKENANWAFQRVGVKAGALKDQSKFSKIADASHVFMKFNSPQKAKLFSLIDWNKVKYNTAGNPSISKTEMKTGYLKAQDELIGMMSDFGHIGPDLMCSGGVFKDEGGIHARVVVEGVMQKVPVRKLFEKNGQVGYTVNYEFKSYPFAIG